MTLFPMTLNNF